MWGSTKKKMKLRCSKEKIVQDLREAGVEYPESATMVQLRSLHATVIDSNEYEDAIDLVDSAASTSRPSISEAFSSVPTTSVPSTSVPSTSVPSTSVPTSSETVTSVPTSVNCQSTTSVPVASTTSVLGLPTTSGQMPSVASASTSRNEADLENQLKYLKMKQEILMLQKSIQEMEAVVPDDNRLAKINFEELSLMVPKFNGTDGRDVAKWFEQFERYVLQFNERKRYMCLKWSLEGLAQEFINTQSSWSYQDVKAAMLKTFKREITREQIYRKLRARTLQASESCIKYIIDMQSIALQGSIDGQELVDIILDGMQDNSNNICILQAANSVDQLIQLIDRYEQRRGKSKQSTITMDSELRGQIRCFNCSQFGHMKNTCPQPLRPPGSCFICHKVGHLNKDCPQRNVTAAVFQENNDDLISPIQTVSVAFKDLKKNKHTNYLNFSALIDSGSPINIISKSCIPADVLGAFNLKTTNFTGVGNCNLKTFGVISCLINFKRNTKFLKFFVVKDNDIKIPIILGRDFMTKFNVKLIYLKNSDNKISVFNSSKKFINNVNLVLNNDDKIIENSDINPNLTERQKVDLKNIIKNCYVKPNNVIQKTNDFKMKIRLTDDIPVFCSPRRLSVKDREEVHNIISDLMNRKIIKTSNSPYASAIVLTKKKTGETRMCVDYRALNKKTIRDNFPLPIIEDCIEFLSGKKWFTLMDLRDGFFHIEMHTYSIQYTSFVTPQG